MREMEVVELVVLETGVDELGADELVRRLDEMLDGVVALSDVLDANDIVLAVVLGALPLKPNDLVVITVFYVRVRSK